MPSFSQHLTTIDKARRQTDTAIKVINPTSPYAAKALAIAWELTFDILCRQNKKSKTEEINTLASILYKLAQSERQLMTVDHQSCKFAEQQTEREVSATEDLFAGITPEMRARLERELGIMPEAEEQPNAPEGQKQIAKL